MPAASCFCSKSFYISTAVEKPVLITWDPCNENRFFPVWKYYTRKTLFSLQEWVCSVSKLSILFLCLYIWTILETAFGMILGWKSGQIRHRLGQLFGQLLTTTFGTILGKKSAKLGIGTCACRTSRFSFCLHLAGSRAVSRRLVLMLSQFAANFGITVVFRAYIQSLEKLYLTFDTFQSTPLTRKWPMLF